MKQNQQIAEINEIGTSHTTSIEFNNIYRDTIKNGLSDVINPLYYDINSALNSDVDSVRTGMQSCDGKIIEIGGNYYQYQLVRSTDVTTPDNSPYYISSSYTPTAFTTI